MKRPPPDWTSYRPRHEEEKLLAAVSLRRHQAKEQPLLRYACGRPGKAGRGDCTMMEVWASKLGPIVFIPASSSPPAVYSRPSRLVVVPQGQDSKRPPKRTAQAHLLEAWLARWAEVTGGDNELMGEALSCKHMACHLSPARLRHDVAAQAGTVLVSQEIEALKPECPPQPE